MNCQGLKFFRVLVLSATLAPLGEPLGAEEVTVSQVADRIEHVTFRSRAFGETKHFCVVLPKDYTARRANVPVLYLLHGRGRNERSLIDIPLARSALLNTSFVTVLPNGEDGWYLDAPANPHRPYGQLLDETISVAESKYHLSREPGRRSIAGWSMGGYGCMHYAVTHPRQFSLVASIIGLIDFPRTALSEGQSYVVPTATFGTNEAAWEKLNPLHSAGQLRGSKVLLIAADQAFDRTMNENFRDRLQQLQIEHEWVVLHGGHKFEIVSQALPMVLERVQARFDESDSSRQRGLEPNRDDQ